MVFSFLRIGKRDGMRRREASGGEDLTDRLVAGADPSSRAAEAYRTLRTNLLYSFVDHPPRVIVLTSPGMMEGKSTTCSNLGTVLAQANKSTLLVDCDFRKPALHKLFGLRNVYGMVDLLAGGQSLEELWWEPVEGLKVVTVGPIPPNPAELLGSQRLSEFLNQARRDFDYVLIDAPPVGLVSDPIILATQGDGVLLVFDAQSTRKGAVRQSMRSLENVGANVLGTVMNNAKVSEGSYYYYYGYGYSNKPNKS